MVAAGEARSTSALRREQQFASQMRVAFAMRRDAPLALRPVPAVAKPHPNQTISQSTPRGRFLDTM